jgi:putative transposase
MRRKELAAAKVRHRYRRLHILLRREGWPANHERTYRLLREEGLSIRSEMPRRKRAWRYRQGRPEVGGPGPTRPWVAWTPQAHAAKADRARKLA